MLLNIFGFLGVAFFPAILAAIGGHLATLTISDQHSKRLAIRGIWVLAGIGIVLAGLQQILAYHSDKEHDEKTAKLQSTATGLETTLDTTLQRQEYMRGQLESISVMVGKVGEKSSDPVVGQLASAIGKISERQAIDARTLILSAAEPQTQIRLDQQSLGSPHGLAIVVNSPWHGSTWPPVSVAVVDACTPALDGSFTAVMDAPSSTYAAAVAVGTGATTGSSHVPLYCDGVAWRVH